MSRALRLEFPGALFHVTSRGNRQQAIFVDDDDRRLFLALMGTAVDRFHWTVPTYVLMGNHFHVLIQLTRETLSTGMRWLNGSYARAFNRRHGCSGHLFQGRPHAPLVDRDSYLLNVLRYIVLNPVRAGMVEHPRDYAWSSHRAVLGLESPPKWLAVDDVLVNFGPNRASACAAYGQFVEEAVTANPWTDLVGQQYLGSETWIEDIREQIKLRPRADDHPRFQRLVGEPRIADVIRAVAQTFSIDEHCVRNGRGGIPRLAAAWIACNEAQLTNREIAAGLQLRSSGHVSNLVRKCDAEIDGCPRLQALIDRCISTLRRKNRKPKLRHH